MSERDGQGEILIMNSDGSGQTQLTYTDSVSNYAPALSHDGGKVVYFAGGGCCGNEFQRLEIIDITGNHMGTVVDGSGLGDAYSTWDPDGTRIAYSSGGEIYLVDIDGSNHQNLTNSPYFERFPSWSPDGTKIAFISNFSGGNPGSSDDVFLMDTEGNYLINLTNHSGYDTKPTWSPDGSKVAFLSDRGENNNPSQIYTVNIDGTGTTLVYDKGLGWGIDDISWAP